ncbi:MAG: MFS transporter [Bacteriovoracaceae bacterium]|nr:MFS transporter [Bacteriovoracaceae bacterium]
MDRNKKQVLIIGMAHLVQDIYPAFIPAITFLLKDKFSLSYFQITLILVCCRLPCLFNPLFGVISNKKIIKGMIVITPMLSSLFIGLLGLSPSYSIILLLAFLAGTSSQMFHVPSPVLVKRLSNRSPGKGMSVYMMGGELARTIGPFLITWFLTILSFEKIYILSILGFLYSLFLLVVFKIEDEILDTNKERNNLKQSWTLFYEKKDLLYTIAGATISKAFTASVVVSLVAMYLKESNYSTFLSGNSLSIMALASFFGVSITGSLSDKVGRRIIILLSTILSPILLIAILSSENHMLVVSLLLFGFVACSTAPVVITYVQECASEIPSFSNGMYMTFNFLLTSIIVLLMGKVADIVGIKNALYLSAMFSLFGFFIILTKTQKLQMKDRQCLSEVNDG